MYQEKLYQNFVRSKFSLTLNYRQTELLILSQQALDKNYVLELVRQHYQTIHDYGQKHPEFINSLVPLANDIKAPEIIQQMYLAAEIAGVGPFAAVAGAIASFTGQQLLTVTSEVVVENGGDIFLKIDSDKELGIFLGPGFDQQTIKIKLNKRIEPFGIASSSAKFGHSLNFGQADLVTVIAGNAIVADALATALSNRIKQSSDVNTVTKAAKNIKDIIGLVIAFDRKLSFWGELELV